MCGGNLRGSGRHGVLTTMAAMLTTLVIAGAITPKCQATEAEANDDCDRRPPEQSIVVSSAAAATDQVGIAVAEDLSGPDALRPIANISEYEPELAEPALMRAVPDLADPVATDLPTAEELEETSEPVPESPVADVIGFHGVTPGISNRREVFQAWGDPRNEETTLPKLDYRFDGLNSVQIHFDGNIVDAIVVKLEKPLATDVLIRKLSLADIRPATLSDDQRVPVAQVFPERGVVLRFTHGADVAIASDTDDEAAETAGGGLFVGEIVIQPIKSAPFVLRAENSLRSHVSNAIADLTQALELDHNSARARWLLSNALIKTGQAIDAERYAAEAAEIEPHDHHYRLQWAKCLRKLARYDRAVEQIRTVLESPTEEPLVRAIALNEMAMLASLGSKKVAKSAVPLHNKAIEIADKLAIGDDATVRAAAKQLLVDAHLSIAVEIARGLWLDKDLTVRQWLERASALAEGMIVEDESQLALRLDVAVSALAAAASLETPIDPLLWVEEAEETTAHLNRLIDDPQTRAQHDWNLGLAYFQAAQIEHRRSAAKSAKRLCRLAETKLSPLATDRDELPDTAYLLGRLYFQMGAVHAVHNEDHFAACQWYDQAADRLLNPVPVTTVANPQQHGDALVSMGVSYWHNENRRQAIEVTQSGVELIEEAVDSGLLDEESLIVPYGNLAAMYEALGDMEPAAKYTQLAKNLTEAESATRMSQRR